MNKEMRSDEVSLLEIVKVLQHYKWLLLILPIGCAVFALLLVSFVLHPQWEASALLEVGKAEQVLVEPVVNVVARMQQPSFAKGALNSSKIKPEDYKIAAGFVSTLNVTKVADADLVEVKLRAPSAEMARNIMNGYIANLQKVHDDMLSVTIKKKNQQYQIISDEIKKLSVETELLRKKLFDAHSWNAFDATLSATILKDKSNDLREMIQKKLLLEEQMSPERTFTTRVINEVYVSDAPVSPKKPLIIGLAILLGLFGAVVLAFAHHALTKNAD